MDHLNKLYYNAAGPVKAPKIFFGTTTTSSTGTWTMSYANAGFAAAPVIAVTAQSTGATSATEIAPNPTAPTATSVSGTASVGVNAIVLSGPTSTAAGAGVVINVIAIGP